MVITPWCGSNGRKEHSESFLCWEDWRPEPLEPMLALSHIDVKVILLYSLFLIGRIMSWRRGREGEKNASGCGRNCGKVEKRFLTW